VALNPRYAEGYINRGITLLDLMQPEEALANFSKAISIQPEFVDAQWNHSLCLLLLGRFEQGWRAYEWRKKRPGSSSARSYPQPLWLGEDNLAGKTVFLHWEQGLGDTIQICRYAPLLEARGAAVIMSVQSSLVGLMKQLSPTIRIIGSNEVPEHFDFYGPLMSLPLAFRTTIENIPAKPRYLAAHDERRTLWSERLPSKGRPRIGLVWSGSTIHRNDHNRSIELRQFLPMLIGGAEWLCLQKEIRDSDLPALRTDGRIAVLADQLNDFSDTAALIERMDLVVTIDTSVAHLAGALGRPVWILLPHNPDWRWLLERPDSPWYPSARLFRQREPCNWATVIAEVKSELQRFCARWPKA
jgi:hypothetical protein